MHNASCDIRLRGFANTANSVFQGLPENLKDATVAMTMGSDGKPVLAVYGSTAEITNDAIAFLRGKGWNVLDAPKARGVNFHAERQLFDAGYTEIGISRQGGMCDACKAFFSDKPDVKVVPYSPPKK